VSYPNEHEYAHVKAVKDAHLQELLAYPNVVGVGIGHRTVGGVRTGQVAVVVMVSSKEPAAGLPPEALLPHELEGIPVDVQEIGDLSVQ
jgi:hypothetical protein